MASLKHNGAELARVVVRKVDSDKAIVTEHFSFGERGWLLKRLDVVLSDGHRVKGSWKRYIKWSDTPHSAETAARNLKAHYLHWGWEVVE